MTSGLGDVAMVSKKLVRAWEDAYRKYGAASEMTAQSRTVDETTAWEMAHASWAVASAWRGIASDRELVWWALAAVESAAEAFEDQARHWETRSHNNENKGQLDGVQRDMVSGAGRGRRNAERGSAHRPAGAGDVPRSGKP